MSLKICFLLIFGFANHQLQLRAEGVKNSCAAHAEWTVIQRRKYGNVDFFRGWEDYVNAFGNCDGDFWLGLETLHQMTKGGDMSLSVNMMTKRNFYGDIFYYVAKYRNFRIGPGTDNYTLHISGYSGDAGDYLASNNHFQFSTKDADHDGADGGDCASARLFGGGWWYGACGLINLNGNFNKTDMGGIRWHYHLLCCSEMKIYKRL